MDDNWIQTFSGKKFSPMMPRIEDIDIKDAAHALSRICRFGGHVNCEIYSVAQHSVMVSELCKPENALYGLLHDLSEAYIGDVVAPLKRSTEFDNYKKIEKHLQSMIYKKFGLSDEEPKDVKKADLIALSTEAAQFMTPLHAEWILPYEPLDIYIEPLLPSKAEKLFLERFKELYNGC